jgi:hypothetical protein
MLHRRAWLTVLLLSAARGPILPAAARAAGSLATTRGAILGAWSGIWTTADGADRGSMEAIITAGRRPSEVLGQFTFTAGAVSRTARRPGQVGAEEAHFPLPGGGRIALRRRGTDGLSGTFLDPRQSLPAVAGTIELRRRR